MTELSEMTTYKVCFPDGSQVTTLPGTKEAFTLEKYIEDLGKTYPRITLFLCPLEDASDSESEQNCWPDLESESDDWLNDVDIADTFHVYDTFILTSFFFGSNFIFQLRELVCCGVC